MSYRRFAREHTPRDIAEEMAFDMVEHRIAVDARRRADLEAKALEGLKARMGKRKGR